MLNKTTESNNDLPSLDLCNLIYLRWVDLFRTKLEVNPKLEYMPTWDVQSWNKIYYHTLGWIVPTWDS